MRSSCRTSQARRPIKRDHSKSPLPTARRMGSRCVIGEGEGTALASRLLDGVVVAENLEAAFRVKAAIPDARCGHLAGEFISREGIVRGADRRECQPIRTCQAGTDRSARPRIEVVIGKLRIAYRRPGRGTASP